MDYLQKIRTMLLNNPNTNSLTCIRGLGTFSVKGRRPQVLALQLYRTTLLQRAEQPNTEASKAVCSTGPEHAAGPQLPVKVLL